MGKAPSKDFGENAALTWGYTKHLVETLVTTLQHKVAQRFARLFLGDISVLDVEVRYDELEAEFAPDAVSRNKLNEKRAGSFKSSLAKQGPVCRLQAKVSAWITQDCYEPAQVEPTSLLTGPSMIHSEIDCETIAQCPSSACQSIVGRMHPTSCLTGRRASASLNWCTTWS